MPTLPLKYGSSKLELTIPPSAKQITHSEPQKNSSLEKAFSNLKLPPVKESIAVVLSDKTRLCEYPKYLPRLTEAIQKNGVAKKNITFFIAYGTHPKQTETECLQAYGETYKRFRFIHHDARDLSKIITLGKTSFGTDISIRKDILDYDQLITFGALSHHYFAGFGGGRKLLFPGLAGYDAILQNHKLFLDFEDLRLHPGCQSGNLDSNPIALDLEQINSKLPDRIEFYAILNSKGEVCEIMKGNSYFDFKSACARYDSFYRSNETKHFDLLIASAGGYPKDINFIQAHKAIHNAAAFVKDGGKLILFLECKDGMGNNRFIELFNLSGEADIFRAMAKNYENNAGTALSLISKTKRIKIYLITSLSRQQCEKMNTLKITGTEAQSMIDKQSGEIAYIKNAGLVYR